MTALAFLSIVGLFALAGLIWIGIRSRLARPRWNHGIEDFAKRKEALAGPKDADVPRGHVRVIERHPHHAHHRADRWHAT